MHHLSRPLVPPCSSEARLDLKRVESALHQFYSHGLASTTQKCYSSSQKHYLSFCSKHNLQPIPPTEHTLLLFISQLGLDNLSPSTIKNYLAAIRNLLIHAGIPNHQLYTPRVELVLRGIKRCKVGAIKSRLPITPIVLSHLKVAWSTHPISQDCRMLWAAACTGFFGFLRCAEFTVPSVTAFDPCKHLTLDDVSVCRSQSVVSTIVLHIKVSKTDQFGKGVDIYLTRTGTSLCPVSALLGYLSARGTSKGPLFVLTNGIPLTRSLLVSRVRSALSSRGFEVDKYSGHSFRIVAATTHCVGFTVTSFLECQGAVRIWHHGGVIMTPCSAAGCQGDTPMS